VLTAEVATILELSVDDVRLHLAVPPVRSNTAASSAAFAAAGDDADRLRRGPKAATSATPPNSVAWEPMAATTASPAGGRTSSRRFPGRSPRLWCCRTGPSLGGWARSPVSPSSSRQRRRPQPRE
jgi:hypothetical protein